MPTRPLPRRRLVAPLALLLGVCLFLPGGASLSDDECLACHGDAETLEALDAGKIEVTDPAVFEGTPHEGFACVDCHPGIEEGPHDPPAGPPECGACHPDAVEAVESGVHGPGTLRNGKVKPAPTCGTCHGRHRILPPNAEGSPVSRENAARTCEQCHDDVGFVEEVFVRLKPVGAVYEGSVHGDLHRRGVHEAALCTDCHDSHRVRPATDPQSRSFWGNIPETCGRCHEQEYEDFAGSVHGWAVNRGIFDAPVCTTCHGIHSVQPVLHGEDGARTGRLALTTCPACHQGVRLNREFGVAGERVDTYLDTYHGVATRLRSKVAADCASCHGVHDILPSSDPRSAVSKANLPLTCGQCHPGATAEFATKPVHVDVLSPRGEGAGPIPSLVARIYIWLIVLTIGGMLLHNGLDFLRAVREPRHEPSPEEAYEKLTRNERIQHGLLAVSFLVLVVTGFALRFPEASWVGWLGFDEATRSLIHRICGVILLALAVFHFLYVTSAERGRKALAEILPRMKDVREGMANLRYITRRSEKKPLFVGFNYAEKLEYWALVWGTAVMGVTGLMLWFEQWTLQYLPTWAFDTAEVIHYYEAWLATLAIVVWHFYQVIFCPRIYPLKRTFLDGLAWPE